jgi:hypothetical protein
MAKRFIDTNIFKKKFMRALPADEKIIFIFLFCECDNAGIWIIDMDILNIYCGKKINLQKLKTIAGDKIHIFDKEERLFIPSFIEFQYSKLQENNNAHKSVIQILRKFNLINDNFELIHNQHIEGLVRGSLAPMDMDMDKDMVKDMDKGVKNEKKIYKSFAHLKINEDEFKKLIELGYSKNQIDDILENIENYTKNKNYKNLFLTAKKWLSKEPKTNNQQQLDFTKLNFKI